VKLVKEENRSNNVSLIKVSESNEIKSKKIEENVESQPGYIAN